MQRPHSLPCLTSGATPLEPTLRNLLNNLFYQMSVPCFTPTGHLITLKGTKWRNLRVKLTPTFTSGKMKMMFPVMVDCANLLKKYLSSASEAGDIIEFKEVFSRFSTDVISSCAFGIESNCINNPNAEFRVFGKKLLEPGFSLVFRFIVPNFFPWIRNIFQVGPLDVIFQYQKWPFPLNPIKHQPQITCS